MDGIASLNCSYFIIFHHFAPLEVAEDSDNHIQGIEAGLEGDILVEIQPAGDHVDDDPDEPLLEVLARQGPDAHDAQGGGEGVEDDIAAAMPSQMKAMRLGM